MKMKFKNLALMSVLIGLNSFTEAKEPSKPQDKKVEQERTPSLGDKLPPYTNPNRFEMDLSFIYWQATEDGLDYGLSENTQELLVPDVAGFTTNPNVGYSLSGSTKDKDLDFKWKPGFKVGIGAIFGQRDQWDLFLNWTWLQSTAHDSFKGAQSFTNELNGQTIAQNPQQTTREYIVPSWGPVVLGGPAAGASSHWRLHYNTVDLELGRNFFLGKSLTLRPHIGLRGAFIHQHVNAKYDSILNITVGQLGGVNATPAQFNSFSPTSKFKGENNYDGGGLRGGLDVNWNFARSFAVYGKMSGSLLYGRFEVEESFKSSGTIVTNVPDDPLGAFALTNAYDLSLHDNFHRVRSTFQLALGMTWHTDFNNDKQHLFISLGYEFNKWFDQNELRELILPRSPNVLTSAQNILDFTAQRVISSFSNETTANRRQGDLALQGLTFGVRFDF